MGLESIHEGGAAQHTSKTYLNTRRKSISQYKTNSSEPPKSDKVEISNDAKHLMQNERIIQKARGVLEQLTEQVREGKINQVTQRIADNFYERREVLERVVESLLEDKEILEAVQGKKKGEGPNKTQKLDPAFLLKLKKKIAEGYYEQDDVLDAIARNILDL